MTQLHWTKALHHDGSRVYVSNPYPKLGETVTITLRAPLDASIRQVLLRSEPDGEGHHTKMARQDKDGVQLWTGELKASMPVNHYRFRILSTEGAYSLNAAGVQLAEGPDFFDFKLLADYESPDWVSSAVFYQIFPDRFRNGDPSLTVKPGAWTKRNHEVEVNEWDSLPRRYDETGNIDFYGGDIPGIIEKLDYLQDLGVNAIYLNPIFTSRSNHRYSIDDFYNVDPYLGGNDALVELREAMSKRDMYLILDLTPNHIGSHHPWFIEAQKNPDADTYDYFTFYNSPDEYETWLGVRSLVKLNYNSDRLREVMYRATDSIVRHWMAEPFRIDGWRMDVQNMTARQGKTQLAHEVWREIREVMKHDNPQSYLMGENFFDATTYLQGDQLDGVMNYSGFTIPVWRWLSGEKDAVWEPGAGDRASISTEGLAEQWRLYRAAVPWVINTQQYNQIDSHDTPRILTIVGGDEARAKIAIGLMMTYIGAPSVYYGDEVGLEGGRDPDNRRTFPWDESRWNTGMHTTFKELIRLRRASPALIQGGFQELYAEGDVFAFLREAESQRVIVIAHRGKSDAQGISLPIVHGHIADDATLHPLFSTVDAASFRLDEGVLTFDILSANAFMVLEVR